jgi:hypothetical protein
MADGPPAVSRQPVRARSLRQGWRRLKQAHRLLNPRRFAKIVQIPVSARKKEVSCSPQQEASRIWLFQTSGCPVVRRPSAVTSYRNAAVRGLRRRCDGRRFDTDCLACAGRTDLLVRPSRLRRIRRTDQEVRPTTNPTDN